MILHELHVLVGGIPLAAVGGVALNDGAVDGINHGLHEFGPKEVLVALLAGVDLYGHLAGQCLAQSLIHPNNIFRRNGLGEINLCFFHKWIPSLSFSYIIPSVCVPWQVINFQWLDKLGVESRFLYFCTFGLRFRRSYAIIF